MERNRLARQIIDTCLEMTRLGLNQGTAGNVSVRYQGGDADHTNRYTL
ncbi:L-fuculose phosphate aldolase [Klebsiella oxytoca]|nr:L-fuculose phosphate aldolase [Klebsiella oxytoca]